jgi:hypothetical protein
VDNQLAYNPGKKVVLGAGIVENHGDTEDPCSIDIVLTVQVP